MKRFAYMTSCAVAALALLVSTAQAKPAVTFNGPSLDGQRVVLPEIDGASEFGFYGLPDNGPALDGRRIALPVESRIMGMPAADEVQGQDDPDGDGILLNGPALDGRRIEVPGAMALAVDRVRLPDGQRSPLSNDVRWPASERGQEVQ